MKYLYILKVGTTFPNTKEKLNDFDTWISRFFQNKRTHYKIIDILAGDKLPNLLSAKGFIITGSHCMVTDELPWSLKLEKYIRAISKTTIPLLGICYGHQLIAKALGGKSDFNKKGKEIGVKKIQKINHNDALFQGIKSSFEAYETHYQSALHLPKDAKVLAKNSHDRHQGVRYTKNIWGVQFHPEFDKCIMEEYLLHQKESLLSLIKCDMSSKILRNFEKVIENKFN